MLWIWGIVENEMHVLAIAHNKVGLDSGENGVHFFSEIGVLCNTGYPPETHLKLKSRETVFALISPVTKLFWKMSFGRITYIAPPLIRRRVLLMWSFGVQHYNDVIMSVMASQITSLTIVYQRFIQAQIIENTKAPRHWPLWREFTGERWIPRTNGQ